MADSSIIPTYLLAKFTRQFVTVALGGDGGDELLAGYDPFIAHSIFGNLQIPNFIIRPANYLTEKIFKVSDENMSLEFKIKHLLRGLPYKPEHRNEIWLSAFQPERIKKILINQK